MSYLNGTIIDGDFDDLFSLNNESSSIKASEDGNASMNYELPLVSPTEYASLSHGQGYNRNTPTLVNDYAKVKDAWKPSPQASNYGKYINKVNTDSSSSSCTQLVFNIVLILLFLYIVMFLFKKSSRRY
jgi:hypothetical protein